MKLVIGLLSAGSTILLMGASSIASTSSIESFMPLIANQGGHSTVNKPNSGAPNPPPPANSGAPSNSPGPIIPADAGK